MQKILYFMYQDTWTNVFANPLVGLIPYLQYIKYV